MECVEIEEREEEDRWPGEWFLNGFIMFELTTSHVKMHVEKNRLVHRITVPDTVGEGKNHVVSHVSSQGKYLIVCSPILSGVGYSEKSLLKIL